MEKPLQYNNCFVCGQDSKNGLKVEFETTEEGARAEYRPEEQFEGFRGIVHGGILCALLDEIMWKAVNGHHGVITVTAKMDVRFKKPVMVKTKLVIEGFVISRKRKFFETKGVISDAEGTVLAEAAGLFMEVDTETASRMSEYLT